MGTLVFAGAWAWRFLFTPVPIGQVIDEQIANRLRTESSLSEHRNPADFSAEELTYLQRRFGIHGPQPAIAQFVTQRIDQFQPLRVKTLTQLADLKSVILRESQEHHVNPMLLTGILYDEIQHVKPGEGLPFVAHSGLVSTHGPAQLGISELIHQGRLPSEPTDEQISTARNLLLDPEQNVALLAGKLQRLKRALNLSDTQMLSASTSYRDAKAIATLAYLHNGKLDYPGRILRYMQDPALHGLIYSSQFPKQSTLI
ncbi:MAG: helicase DnaB [Synechococcus sp.]